MSTKTTMKRSPACPVSSCGAPAVRRNRNDFNADCDKNASNRTIEPQSESFLVAMPPRSPGLAFWTDPLILLSALFVIASATAWALAIEHAIAHALN
jgi:hypothetical protein